MCVRACVCVCVCVHMYVHVCVCVCVCNCSFQGTILENQVLVARDVDWARK